MRLIKGSVKLFKQRPGIEGLFHHIERCGRICYKSEDKISEDTSVEFVNLLLSRKHYAMLEHGTVYFKLPIGPDYVSMVDWFIHNPYSTVSMIEGFNYITTNLRVLVESFPDGWKVLLDDCLEQPDNFNLERYTAHFTLSRGIANEFVRHRVFSFAQESTRFCNYSKAKFNGVTFIIPEWLRDDLVPVEDIRKYIGIEEPSLLSDLWLCNMQRAEDDYLKLIEKGVLPQDARGVLPLDLKTELIMTGTVDQWKDFFDLRYRGITGPPHPDAHYLASLLHHLFRDQYDLDL